MRTCRMSSQKMIPSMDLKATSMLFLVVKVDIVTIFKKKK